jgi:hypothetical protein
LYRIVLHLDRWLRIGLQQSSPLILSTLGRIKIGFEEPISA